MFAEINQVLDDLEAALASSKASLLRTMDAEAVGRWSDDEKRDWWNERKDGDKAVKTLLKSLEASLGAWKYLLCADVTDVDVLTDPTRFDHVQAKGHPSLAPVAGWLSLLLKGVHDGEDPTDCIVALLTQFDGGHTDARLRAQRIIAEERVAAKAPTAMPPPPAAVVVKAEEEDAVDALSGALESMKVTDLRKKLREEGLPTEGLKSELVARLKGGKSGTATVDATPARKSSSSSSSGMRSAMKTPGLKGAKTPSRKKLTIFCEKEEDEHAAATERKKQQQALPLPPSVRKDKAKKTISFDDAMDKDEDPTGPVNEPTTNDMKGGHTLLILDERLQALPWESMPCLRGRQCSRLPSLALLLGMSYDLYNSPQAKADIQAFLQERRSVEIEHLQGSGDGDQEEDQENTRPHDDNLVSPPPSAAKKCISPLRSPSRKSKTPGKTPAAVSTTTNSEKFLDSRVSLSRSWYAVDPESNLPHTRATMSAFLDPFAKQYDWEGVIAAVPSESVVKEQHDKSQLFIFCGHGAGEKVCDSQRLKKSHCPAAMLWGCSSGRLALQGVHDPTGVALQYLIRGSPFVLGNLWDVTDKDIDKLSVACMSSLFDKRSLRGDNRVAVAEALAASRAVCKMMYAVGSAPVMYGLPLAITK